jgi:hypothetical protein
MIAEVEAIMIIKDIDLSGMRFVDSGFDTNIFTTVVHRTSIFYLPLVLFIYN